MQISLIEKIISEWGERDSYLVNEAEFRALSQSNEASLLKEASPNGDGTFTSELLIRGKKFVLIS